MNDYFLHSECGYTFDEKGVIGALTPQEEKRLWKGYQLFQREIVNREEGQSKPGRTATSGDRREFQKFADEVNTDA